MSEEVIMDGVANSGSVFRRGNQIIRPAGPHSTAVHSLLRYLEKIGFAGAPRVIALEGEREVLSFVDGIAPTPPYSPWMFTDENMHRLAVLQKSFHDAVKNFVPAADSAWNRSLADPLGVGIICHNDMGPGNIVFKNEEPTGIIDFDFTAPGRKVWDIARMVRVWAPLDWPESAATYGLGGLDPIRRLRSFADGHELSHTERMDLSDILEECNTISVAYVRSQMEAGKPSFIKMWNDYNLGELYEKRRQWMELHRSDMRNALS